MSSEWYPAPRNPGHVTDANTVDGRSKTAQQIAAQRRLEQSQAQVEEVVNIMRKNVEKVLEKDEGLEKLEARADAMEENAARLQQQTGKLTQTSRCGNVKRIVILGIIGLIFIWIIGNWLLGDNHKDNDHPILFPPKP